MIRDSGSAGALSSGGPAAPPSVVDSYRGGGQVRHLKPVSDWRNQFEQLVAEVPGGGRMPAWSARRGTDRRRRTDR
jgi:hypothetical protein